MMQFSPAYLALTLMATPAIAQDMEFVLGCSGVPIDAPDCPADKLAAELGLLTGGQMAAFRDSRMESFAILTSLRLTSSALFFRGEGEGCIAEEERYQAVEIWDQWVQLPEDATAQAAYQFSKLNELMFHVSDMEITC